MSVEALLLSHPLLEARVVDAELRTRAVVALEALLTQARERWPGVEQSDEACIAHLAPRLSPAGPLHEAIEAIRGDDLVLALACARGDRRAIAHFEQLVRKDLAAIFRSPTSRGVDPDDLRQILNQRFFASPGDRPPRILEYSGQGPLRTWVRVSATRERISADRRKGDKAASLPERDEHIMNAAGGDDPEFGFLQAHYRVHFKRAFGRAMGGLTARQRNLLRLTTYDGLSATDLSKLYNVDRSTSKRWLVSARAQLLADTRTSLAEDLDVSIEELESILRLIESNLEVSMQRLLGEDSDDE
ncbi:MAG: sigma-70 family RNA polymerase sigma factor [Myxococcota bacterium]